MDKWSTREQLCLASAVSCNGDQNWTNVSRSLKIVCGADRPADWFSLKSCAQQYEELLEHAETIKKAQSSVTDGSVGSAAVGGGNSLDIILRRLKDERMQELKAEIRREQEEYAKICNELKALQGGQLTDNEVLEMWKDIEKEQEMQRIEEMKLENQLREREQNKQDMQRNWRANVGASLTPAFASQKTEENLQDIIGSNKSLASGIQQQQATSPLLTSLLKSPTTGSAPAVLGNSAHVTSPTITTLLTGGAIIKNQPAITLKNTIPANEAAQLLTRPISGPPIDALPGVSSGAQNLLSPSQSAPTLSMLLEKSKVTAAANPTKSSITGNTTNPIAPLETIKEKKLSGKVNDSNNEEVPMDIEEDMAAVSAAADLLDADDSDADANEEQQLLEVFKNIGNIDELEDIDVAAVINEEVDFLKDVGDEPVDEAEDIDFTDDQTVQQSKNLIDDEQPLPQEKPTKSIKKMEKDPTEVNAQKTDTKVETISSDDSNDNIPLATLGSSSSLHESKVMGQKAKFDKELHEPKTKGKDGGKLLTQAVDDDDSSLSENSKDLKESKNLAAKKSPGKHENSEVIIIPTDDESTGDKQQNEAGDKNKQTNGIESEMVGNDITDETSNNQDINSTLTIGAAEDESTSTGKKCKASVDDNQEDRSMISPADSEEESSEATDISGKIDEKMLTLEKLSAQLKKSSNEQKVESGKLLDEDSTQSQPPPVKPQAIRKLRDRDRSESPMPSTMDDETTTASDHSVTQRLRRRYSSTPVIDSIPSSPVLSDRDERDLKTSKKYLLSVYNALMSSKNASALQQAVNENVGKFKQICTRFTDFPLIKKNIENSVIRSIYELQRDVLLLCQNAVMVFETNSHDYKIVCEFIRDCQNVKEFVGRSDKTTAMKTEKDSSKESRSSTSSSGVKVRGSSRKSQRIT